MAKTFSRIPEGLTWAISAEGESDGSLLTSQVIFEKKSSNSGRDMSASVLAVYFRSLALSATTGGALDAYGMLLWLTFREACLKALCACSSLLESGTRNVDGLAEEKDGAKLGKWGNVGLIGEDNAVSGAGEGSLSESQLRRMLSKEAALSSARV